ncbi:MAG: hypothetical protein ACYTFQ_33295 [Planctomycetota bacterium]
MESKIVSRQLVTTRWLRASWWTNSKWSIDTGGGLLYVDLGHLTIVIGEV